MRTWIVILFVLLLAAPASAGTWLKNCQSGRTTTALTPGEYACYAPADIDDDSVLLNLASCENFDTFMFDNPSAGVAATTTVLMQCCPAGVAASAAACWPLENVIFDGDETTDTEAVYGAKAFACFVDPQNDGALNGGLQIDVHCNGPKN